MSAFADAITLYQVHAFEGDVEARVVGILEQHELAAMSAGLDLAKSLELADAVIDVDDVVARFQFGEIAEETGGANFAARAFDCGSDVEKIGVAEERDVRFRKGDAFGEGCANQQHGRGFVRAFGGESGGSIFRFAKHIGDFILAANVRKALDLSGAGCGQENRPSGRELGLHVAHAGYDIAVKTRTGPRGELELGNGTNSESKLLDAYLRGFFQCGGEFSFGPEVVRGGGRVGASVAFIIFGGSREMLLRGLPQSLWLIEKHDRTQRAFRQLKEVARPWFGGWPEKRWRLPCS